MVLSISTALARQLVGHLLCELFNVVAGTGIVGQVQHARKFVQAISHGHIYCLSEDVVFVV